MHTCRLLLLSLVVFASAVYAGDKENSQQYNVPFLNQFVFPNSGNVSQKRLSERRSSVPVFPQPLPSTAKPQDVPSENDLLRKEFQRRLQELRGDLLEGQAELQRQISGIEPQIVERVEKITGSLSNAVVEVVEKPHDLQPAVNDLTSQLKELSEKMATAVTQQEVEDLKKDVAAICEAVQDLPTVQELVEASKQYTDQYFATKREMTTLFVDKHKVVQKAVGSLKKDIEKVTKQMPTQSDPQGFARNADVDGRVDSLKKQMATKFVTAEQLEQVKQGIPTVANPQGFAKQDDVDQTAKNLQKDYQEIEVRLQTRIADLEKNSPKEQAKAGMIYLAKQGALGCVSYQLSPHMASLLRSLKLENSYVDLETVALPTTTFAVSFLARLAKEAHEKGQEASLKDVGRESLIDAGVSAGVMGLRSICFDDEMNEYVDQLSEGKRTAGYAGCYALLRSLVALFL